MHDTNWWLDGRTRPSIRSGIVSSEIDDNVECIVYEPGNGTRYELVFVQMSDAVLRMIGYRPSSVMVTLVNIRGKTMFATKGAFLHPGYVKEKMDIGISDAYVLAEIISYCVGSKSLDATARMMGEEQDELK